MTRRSSWRHMLLFLVGGLMLMVGCTEIVSTPTAQVGVTDVPISAESTDATETTIAPDPSVSEVVVIEPSYRTPSQAEGPYYPVNKPADHDSDLVVVAGSNGSPAGRVLDLSGKIYDVTGMALSGVLIEIWQTDNEGIYDHPGDRSTDNRDLNFQFYGEAITAADGSYAFRTIVPGKYEPRPVHIHYKVKANGQTLLTSQMYFEGDPDLANDGIFASGGDGVHMLVALSDGQDAAGNPLLVGVRDVVLSMELPAYYPK